MKNMKIDFYVLEVTQAQKSLFFACQLLEKIHAENKRAYIHANSLEEAERLDGLLWTYREDSFIPHNIYQASDDAPPPIQIGYGEKPLHHQDILINLGKEIPEFYQQFNHVIEIVFTDPLVQQLARERYRLYRDNGYQITTHKIKANEL